MESPAQPARSSRGLWFALVLAIAALSGTAGFAYREYEARQAYGAALGAATAQSDNLAAELSSARAMASSEARDRGRLAGELEDAKRQAADAAREAEQLKRELTSGLDAEIQKGALVVRERGQDVVIDVSEEVLFETGMADIGGRGKQVLVRVAKAVVQQQNRLLEIGGHTDDSPIVSRRVRDKFPTNWELSTARATAVVRFLEQQCGVPGNRLVAAGYSQHRPKVSNVNDEGRKLNRRIEIALLPAPPASSAPLPVASAPPPPSGAVTPQTLPALAPRAKPKTVPVKAAKRTTTKR